MAKKKRIEMYYQLPRGLCLEELTDEEAGVIWKAIARYTGEREKMPTALMRVIYKQCCDHIDAEDERYNDFCERQKERSRMRKMYQDKQSDDNLGYPRITMDNLGHPSNHNHKQNTESETQSKSESESKTESQSEGKINLPPYRGEEEVRATDSFVSQCCSDRQWLEVIAMKTHLPIGKVIEKLKDADMTMIADGDYPKSINEYKARAHRIITNVKKKEDNGDNKPYNATNILADYIEQCRQSIPAEGEIPDEC